MEGIGKLRLRKLREGDRDDFVLLESDPDTTAFTGRSTDAEEMFRYCMEKADSCALTLDGIFIGHFTFHRTSLTDVPGGLDAREVSFGISPECRGLGIGTKALGLAAQRAKKDLKADVLMAGAYAFNGACLQVLERNGFRYLFSRKDRDPEGNEREEKIFMKLL